MEFLNFISVPEFLKVTASHGPYKKGHIMSYG